MSITYRVGRKGDCPKLADFIYIASDGVVEFLFQDLIPGCSPQQIMAQNLKKGAGHYTYKNAIVAVNERTVGNIMKLFFLIFFIVLGALDFLYGLLYKDQLSIMAGGAIVVITVYIWKKKT